MSYVIAVMLTQDAIRYFTQFANPITREEGGSPSARRPIRGGLDRANSDERGFANKFAL